MKNLALSVNPVDAKIRAAGTWTGVTPPFVPGYDAAGIVARVGPGVQDLAEGNEVYCTTVGSLFSRGVVPRCP